MSSESHVHVHACVGCLQVNILENFATDLETKYFSFDLVELLLFCCFAGIGNSKHLSSESDTVNTQAPLHDNVP